jgi:hypothetical protein
VRRCRQRSPAFSCQRFWARTGGMIDLSDGGFLRDPTGLFARSDAAGARQLRELAGYRALALLGEPGIGKSTTLSEEAARVGEQAGAGTVSNGSPPRPRDVTQMYGPAVRSKKLRRAGSKRSSMYRPLIGALCSGPSWISAPCDLISGQASTGPLGHQCSQCSHAPGRPNLHLVSSSRRPWRLNKSTTRE